MATFKVGQRVRIVRAGLPALLGREATIIRIPGELPKHVCDAMVDGFDGRDIGASYEDVGVVRWSDISPLTDPGADAFLERIKKLKPYDEPKVVTTEHGTALFPK